MRAEIEITDLQGCIKTLSWIRNHLIVHNIHGHEHLKRDAVDIDNAYRLINALSLSLVKLGNTEREE
jgi:hypothetical protein